MKIFYVVTDDKKCKHSSITVEIAAPNISMNTKMMADFSHSTDPAVSALQIP